MHAFSTENFTYILNIYLRMRKLEKTNNYIYKSTEIIILLVSIAV